jgi:hypothetical protein
MMELRDSTYHVVFDLAGLTVRRGRFVEADVIGCAGLCKGNYKKIGSYFWSQLRKFIIVSILYQNCYRVFVWMGTAAQLD